MARQPCLPCPRISSRLAPISFGFRCAFLVGVRQSTFFLLFDLRFLPYRELPSDQFLAYAGLASSDGTRFPSLDLLALQAG